LGVAHGREEKRDRGEEGCGGEVRRGEERRGGVMGGE